jgi:hypothetical protein
MKEMAEMPLHAGFESFLSNAACQITKVPCFTIS